MCASILSLGYCIVADAECNWYHFDINTYSLSKKCPRSLPADSFRLERLWDQAKPGSSMVFHCKGQGAVLFDRSFFVFFELASGRCLTCVAALSLAEEKLVEWYGWFGPPPA
jgi:hypothetical protein